MKLTKLALAASMAIGLASSHAATINISNADFSFSGTDLLFLDNTGAPLAQGFVALSTSADISGIIPGGIDILGAGNYPGLGIYAGSISVANTGSLTGANLFLIIGDNADPNLANIAVIDTGRNFNKADSPPPPASIDFSAGPGASAVGGTLGSVTIDASAFGGPASYVVSALQVVPEPSSSLLFGLAGLALLIRRKR
jgi:hypothetical protein